MPASAFTADVRAALRLASEPQLLRTLDRLRFIRQHSVGQNPGATPVKRVTQATGLEIAAHKPYVPGDDLRYVDWNALARLDQRIIKRFQAEREAPLHLVIDASASMAVPAADGKFAFAIALAAGLAYIALQHGHPARAVVLGGGPADFDVSPLIRHAGRLPELHAFLGPRTAGGPTRLGEGTAGYLRSTQLPGTVVVLSDFLVPASTYERALDEMRARGYDIAALRIIGPHERDASDLPRRVRLRDAESGAERDVDLTVAHRQRYAEMVQNHLEQLARWCIRRGIAYHAADPGVGLSTCFLRDLPRAGLLQ
ncbi:MAG: DUF58 domain-containing protein [Candidatus Binatia bacterium]